MSSERFDKLMKKQLESVRPTYQPGAWDRFQKRLPVVGFWPWLFRYGGWALSGLLLTGWIATLYSLHENQQLIRQLGTVLAKPNRPGTPISASPIHRVDTVYIVKRTVVEHQHYYAPTSSLPVESEQIVSSDSAARPLIEQHERLGKTTALPNETTARRLRTQSGSRRRFSVAASTEPLATTQLGRTRSKGTKPKAVLPVGTDSVQSAASNRTNPAETVVTDKLQPIAAESSSKPAVRPDSVAQKPINLPVATEAKVLPAEQRRPAFQFSSLKPRVGVETMGTPHSIGVGPTIELFPSETIGLSVGLQATGLHSENHRGLDDFNSATGKEFIDQYRAFLPTQYDRIEDISIRTAVISLPISLKYYVPLSNRWSVLFQTGTSFDLAAYQQVWYESFYRGVEQHNSFEVKATPQFFHNFMFGAGLQFHKSRISGQLAPYYRYDFRSIVNTPGGSNLGLKASVWLDLFK